MEIPAFVSDIRHDVVNALNVIKNDWSNLSSMLEKLKLETNVLKLKEEFYDQRDNMWQSTNDLERAYRFMVIRQLVFSGMDRIGKSGKENAPFAWYERFKTNCSNEHHDLMKTWTIKEQDFEKTLNELNNDDFVFLDPPYLSRNSTYGGESQSDIEFHERLIAKLKTLKNQWLLVHCDHELYRERFKDLKTIERTFSYGQNFKGRNNSKSKTVHLYIQNYV